MIKSQFLIIITTKVVIIAKHAVCLTNPKTAVDEVINAFRRSQKKTI
jgi:hypothetical protein